MFVRFKCHYSAKCGSSSPRSHRHKAVLSPVALMFEMSRVRKLAKAAVARRLERSVRRQTAHAPRVLLSLSGGGRGRKLTGRRARCSCTLDRLKKLAIAQLDYKTFDALTHSFIR